MKNVDLYGRVRHAVLIDGMSSREAARVFGVDPALLHGSDNSRKPPLPVIQAMRFV